MGIIHIPHSESCLRWHGQPVIHGGYDDEITLLLRDVEVTFYIPCCQIPGIGGRISKMLEAIERYTAYRFIHEKDLDYFLNGRRVTWEKIRQFPKAYHSSYTCWYEKKDFVRCIRGVKRPRCFVCHTILPYQHRNSWCSDVCWKRYVRMVKQEEREKKWLRKNKQSLKMIRAYLRDRQKVLRSAVEASKQEMTSLNL